MVVTGEEMEFTTEGTEDTEKSGSVGGEAAGGELKMKRKEWKEKREREREERKVIAFRV